MKWITALDLSRWADTTGARTALSEPVSALIRAAASDIRSFRFRAGDAAQIPDYDGRLSARGVAPYIPDGESVWEFGIAEQYLDKANQDFIRRTNAPGDIVKVERHLCSSHREHGRIRDGLSRTGVARKRASPTGRT